MPSSPTCLLARILALSALPNPLPAADLLNGVPVEVLGRSTVEAGGRRITFVRIRPPALPILPPAAPTSAAEPSPAALAEEARLAAKLYAEWQPTVVVHLRPPVVSELRFEVGGRAVTVWTNVDFTTLASVSQWETATTVYTWFPTITDVDAADDIRPADLQLASGPAEYVVEATAAELAGHESDLAPLEALVAHHDLHRVELLAEQARRAAQAIELARQAAEAPPKPKEETIYFWKNENPLP